VRSDRMGEVVVPTGSILWGEYAEYNKEYFGNTLPYATIDYVDIITQEGVHKGEHEVLADVEHNASTYHIRVDKTFNPILKTADLSLLHEMCHIKLDASGEVPLTVDDDVAHGDKFQGCMISLSSRGAMRDLW